MITQNDLDINRGVRRVFVKHWVDLGRMSIRTAAGRVLIRGFLRRIEGSGKENLTSPIVTAMFHEVRRMRGVAHLTVHLDNWINDGGMWRPFERQTLDKDEQLGVGGGSFSME